MNTQTNGHAEKGTKIRMVRGHTVKAPETVDIPRIERQVVPVTVVGISPLLMKAFDEKTKAQLEAASTGKVEKKTRGNRPPRDPQDEFQRARLLNEKGQDCVPARYIKAAIVTAGVLGGISKPTIRGTLYVTGPNGEELLPIRGDKARLRMDWGRVKSGMTKVPMQIYRAEHVKWALDFHVEFEPAIIPHARLINLIMRAGLSVGLCEWRPEKSGDLGRFEIGKMGQ